MIFRVARPHQDRHQNSSGAVGNNPPTFPSSSETRSYVIHSAIICANKYGRRQTFMGRFAGTLLISGSQSSVNGDILLKAGISDPSQAISAATSFVQAKGFKSGFSVVVIGTKGQVDSVSGILMSDVVSPPAPAAQTIPSTLLGETAVRSAARPRASETKKRSRPRPKPKARPKKRNSATRSKKRRATGHKSKRPKR